MTAPVLLEPDKQKLEWEKTDKAIQERYQNQQVQDSISPTAGQLPYDTYYTRLDTIRNNSASATAGSIQADANVSARNDALKQQEWARIQAKAQADAAAAGQAYGQNDPSFGALNYAGGAGSNYSGDWGGGGAQGVANVLRRAGFSEAQLPVMMAIAMAESSWNPGATHSNSNGTIDQGLFQINSVHKGNSWYPTNPMDPLQSAIAAYNIYQSQGLNAWSVYNSGAYRQFVPSTVPAAVPAAQSFAGAGTTASRAKALQISQQVLNIPYVWGGDSLQTGVDCSGLVQQVYAQIGISMPRQARAQATTGVRVSSYNQLQPGDLVAFKWAGGYAGPNIVSHIAIYMGGGRIIEAAGGSRGDIRYLGNSQQDQGAIYIHTRFPGE